jgi:hypothetical protein
MRGEGQNAFRSVSLLYLPDKEVNLRHINLEAAKNICSEYDFIHSFRRKFGEVESILDVDKAGCLSQQGSGMGGLGLHRRMWP